MEQMLVTFDEFGHSYVDSSVPHRMKEAFKFMNWQERMGIVIRQDPYFNSNSMILIEYHNSLA